MWAGEHKTQGAICNTFCQSCWHVSYSGRVPLLPWVNFDVVSHVCCGYRVWYPVEACLVSYHLLHAEGMLWVRPLRPLLPRLTLEVVR